MLDSSGAQLLHLTRLPRQHSLENAYLNDLLAFVVIALIHF
ncbi:hypothetical protein JCM19233_1288 [Vibrio astriarenae]|nr:hypothetical protein JCM19233_1288 [Vibrio sp. C7]